MRSHIEWLSCRINASMDCLVRIKLVDLKVIDGKVVEGSEGLHPICVGLIFNYVLFNNGIYCGLGELKDKQPVLVMRQRVDDDVLPALFTI